MLSALAGHVLARTDKTAKFLLVETGEGFHGDSYAAEPGESLAWRLWHLKNKYNNGFEPHRRQSVDGSSPT